MHVRWGYIYCLGSVNFMQRELHAASVPPLLVLCMGLGPSADFIVSNLFATRQRRVQPAAMCLMPSPRQSGSLQNKRGWGCRGSNSQSINFHHIRY